MKRIMGDEVKNTIKEMVSNLLEVDPEKISMKSEIRNDLGADSLDFYELQYMLDAELGIIIPDDLSLSVITVEDFVNWYEAGEDS